MTRELTEADFCPKCLEYDDKHVILYMGRANFATMSVKFSCPMCDFVEVRTIESTEE